MMQAQLTAGQQQINQQARLFFFPQMSHQNDENGIIKKREPLSNTSLYQRSPSFLLSLCLSLACTHCCSQPLAPANLRSERLQPIVSLSLSRSRDPKLSSPFSVIFFSDTKAQKHTHTLTLTHSLSGLSFSLPPTQARALHSSRFSGGEKGWQMKRKKRQFSVYYVHM